MKIFVKILLVGFVSYTRYSSELLEVNRNKNGDDDEDDDDDHTSTVDTPTLTVNRNTFMEDWRRPPPPHSSRMFSSWNTVNKKQDTRLERFQKHTF